MARVTHLADLMHRAEASNGTAIPSNWILSTDGTKALAWRPETSSSGSVSYGSNATHVSDSSDGGAAANASRSDHRHLGVRSVSHASNTLFGDLTLQTEGGLYIVKPGPGILKFGSTSSGGSAGGTSLTIEEVDGSPTVSATKLVLPNGTLGVVGTVATYTPAAAGGGGAPLGITRYAPGSDGAVGSTTSTSLVDLDATNATVTFTTPASGNVIVDVRASFGGSAVQNYFVGLRESTTDVAGPSLIFNQPIVFAAGRSFYFTGLSAGSHTYKLAIAVQGGTLTVYGGPTYGQVEMTVWAA